MTAVADSFRPRRILCVEAVHVQTRYPQTSGILLAADCGAPM